MPAFEQGPEAAYCRVVNDADLHRPAQGLDPGDQPELPDRVLIS